MPSAASIISLLRGLALDAPASNAGAGDLEGDSGATNAFYDASLYSSYSISARRNLARVDEAQIDYDLIEALLTHIQATSDDGAVLVFLPGMGEISAVQQRLQATQTFRDGEWWIVPLHSTVDPEIQRSAFLVPSDGVRKIVLATNIAETSLTIPDVVFVVDSGKLKEKRHDAGRGMSLLVEDWVSRAAALQRKGRAGRVQPGQCFSLFTRQRFEDRMKKYQAPEMVRVPLEELVLQIHLLKLGPAEAFLNRVLQPPPAKAVEGAVAELQAVGALDAQEHLTPLGHHLAQLPMDAKAGKLLLLGVMLGCLGPALTVAACLSHRSPFAADTGSQDRTAKAQASLSASGGSSFAAGQQSDHLVMVAAFNAWADAIAQGGRKAGYRVAQQHSLTPQVLEMLAEMRQQFASMLADSRLVPESLRGPRDSRRRKEALVMPAWLDGPEHSWNSHAKDPSVVMAALCGAMQPNLSVMDAMASATSRPGWNDGTGDVSIHPSSSLHPLASSKLLSPYLIYSEKVRTSRTFLRNCTVTSATALLLFGGSLEVVYTENNIVVDGWLKLRAPAASATLLTQLRAALDARLQKTVANPSEGLVLALDPTVQCIVDLLKA